MKRTNRSHGQEKQNKLRPATLTQWRLSQTATGSQPLLLFKQKIKWTPSQKQRAELLFEHYPKVKQAYDLSMKLGDIFRQCKCKEEAFKKLALWHNQVIDVGIESFRTVSRTMETHYEGILNFFDNRSTNASAESFNAKIKAFRAWPEA